MPAVLAWHDDKLVELIDDPMSSITQADKGRVLTGMSKAPFRRDPPRKLYELSEWDFSNVDQYVGTPHPSRPDELLTRDTQLDRLEWHVVKHRFDEYEVWKRSTTADEYLHDLEAVLAASHHLDVGARLAQGSRKKEYRAAGHVDLVNPDLQLSASASQKVGCSLLAFYDPECCYSVSFYATSSGAVTEKLSRWRQHRRF